MPHLPVIIIFFGCPQMWYYSQRCFRRLWGSFRRSVLVVNVQEWVIRIQQCMAVLSSKLFHISDYSIPHINTKCSFTILINVLNFPGIRCTINQGISYFVLLSSSFWKVTSSIAVLLVVFQSPMCHPYVSISNSYIYDHYMCMYKHIFTSYFKCSNKNYLNIIE